MKLTNDLSVFNLEEYLFTTYDLSKVKTLKARFDVVAHIYNTQYSGGQQWQITNLKVVI